MQVNKAAGAASALLGISLLVGCGGNDPAPEASQAQAEPADGIEASDGAGDADEVCAALGDVMTIVENTDLAAQSGRIDDQEVQGWYTLATRVLDRIPPPDDADLAQGVRALQDVAPRVDAGQAGVTPEFGSPTWDSAVQDVAQACGDAGVDLAIAPFTGG